MSMFGDGTVKEDIYQELRYMYDERYGDWDNAESKLDFTTKVLDVLNTMFGEW